MKSTVARAALLSALAVALLAGPTGATLVQLSSRDVEQIKGVNLRCPRHKALDVQIDNIIGSLTKVMSLLCIAPH